MAGLSNEPDMKIAGQVNKALEDLRQCLTAVATESIADKPMTVAQHAAKARYITDMAVDMCVKFNHGEHKIPWREYQPMIEEEFS